MTPRKKKRPAPAPEPEPLPPEPPPPPDPVPPPVEPSPSSAFLSRSVRSNVVVDGGTDVELSQFSLMGGSLNNPSGIGITLKNVSGAFIHHIDAKDLVGFIYLYNCTNVVIEDCRGRNIGDGSIGSGHSNYVQFAASRGGAIRRCKFLGGRSEDMISTWHSGGYGVGNELIIEDNQLQGLVADTATARAWTSGSGTGVIVSDGAGSATNGYIIVRHNTLLTPGQVGIQHIDGPGLQTYGNIIYGQQRTGSNNPATSWEGSPVGVFHDNRYYWQSPNGTLVSPWFRGGVAPNIDSYNNTQDASLDPANLIVTL